MLDAVGDKVVKSELMYCKSKWYVSIHSQDNDRGQHHRHHATLQ